MEFFFCKTAENYIPMIFFAENLLSGEGLKVSEAFFIKKTYLHRIFQLRLLCYNLSK